MAIAAESFKFVRDMVLRESAIQLETGKEYLVESRLLPLARQAGASDVDSYIAKLRQRTDTNTQRAIVEALTTNETSFFRDNSPYLAMKDHILPELAGRKVGPKSIRMWSAACSSGQETYSMLITCLEHPQLKGYDFSVLATDINQQMVKRTLEGKYNQLEMNRGMPAPILVKYFQRQGADWAVNAQLKGMVRAQEMNLIRPFPAIGNFDIVFLRNVLIYFDVSAKRTVLQKIRQHMTRDGYLILGAGETTQGVDDGWERHTVGRTTIFKPKKGI